MFSWFLDVLVGSELHCQPTRSKHSIVTTSVIQESRSSMGTSSTVAVSSPHISSGFEEAVVAGLLGLSLELYRSH